ncbi:MAG TPA: hypothetical protein VGM83_00355 [Devosiaceae bacterium]|jgi:hypothetical protein
MLKAIAAALLLTALPIPVVMAQDAPAAQDAPVTQDAPAPTGKRDCKELMRLLPQFEGAPDSTLETLPDGCAATHLVISGGQYQRWTIDRLSLTGIDMNSTAVGAPQALQLDAKGLAFAPDVGNPVSAYIMKVRQQPLDVHLAYHYDDAQKQMHLDATVTGEGYGDFGVSATILGFSPADINFSEVPDTAKIAIAGLSTTLENKEMIESFIVPMVASMTPTDGDPEKFIGDGKAGLIAMIGGLPDATASATSKDALSRFVGDFPHPRGKLDLDVEPTPPLKADDLEKLDNPMSLLTLLGKIKLTASYEQPAG